jgi:hypothetical protein
MPAKKFWPSLSVNSKIVICIARLRNPTLTNREKNCRQGRQDNLEVVKGFRSQGVHILCATRKFVIIK